MSKKIEWEQFFVWNKKKFKLKSKLCFLPSITYFPYLKNNIAQFHISTIIHLLFGYQQELLNSLKKERIDIV